MLAQHTHLVTLRSSIDTVKAQNSPFDIASVARLNLTLRTSHWQTM
jgi:hypothetical protein